MWLQEQLGESVEFWVSDERLVTAAGKEHLTVIDPSE